MTAREVIEIKEDALSSDYYIVNAKYYHHRYMYHLY